MKAILISIFMLTFYYLNSQSNSFAPFEIADAFAEFEQLAEPLENYTILKLNNYTDFFNNLGKENSTDIELTLPIDESKEVVLSLSEQNIFDPNFRLVERNGAKEIIHNYNKPLFLNGTVNETESSLASLTFFDGKIMGVIAFSGNNYNLKFLSSDEEASFYLLYKDKDLKQPFQFQCDDNEVFPQSEMEGLISENIAIANENALGPVSIYIECDYQMYQDNGNSVSSAANFTTGLFNVVKGIYATSGLTLNISEIYVWSSLDPYDANNATSSSDILGAFRCEKRNGYNGRLAHILTTAPKGLGGLANRPYGDCTGNTYTAPIYGMSNISNYYNTDLNVYSWSVEVFTHELGHNLSAPHTHSCAWNGNDTQIDDCGNIYLANNGNATGACYDANNPIIPTNGGTVMSYCHLNSVGIDLTLGFHPQVATKMNDFVNNCLSATIAIACPTPGPEDMSVTNISSTSVSLNCSITSNDYYDWAYREVGETWIGLLGTSANSTTITGLQPGVNYEFSVVLYCNSCSCWGSWACENKAFTTSNPINYADFIGHWNNEDPNTSGIPVTIIREDVSNLFVHNFGKCHPYYCDWGEQLSTVVNSQDGQIEVLWNPGFKLVYDTLTLVNDTTLQRDIYTTYTDDSGRADRYETFLMYKKDCTNGQFDINQVTGDNITYWASSELTSNGAIESGQTITLKGGTSITLRPGFHAKAGSSLVVRYDNSCSGQNNLAITELAVPRATVESMATQNDFDGPFEVKIFPNPAQNQLTIVVNKETQGFQLELFDVMGRRINYWQVATNQKNIEVQHLENGVYFLRIDGVLTKKMMINR